MTKSTEPRRPRTALVIPALDEEAALPFVLAELPKGLVDELVVVDNGSRDRTAEFARAGGARVIVEPRRGYGSACLAGLAAVFGEHADPASRVVPPLGDDDVVAFLDADHSDFPEDLVRVLAPILAGRADFVIGSRVLGGADMRAMLPQAWFGNRFACALMRVFFGAHYTDLGPFRAIRAGALRALGMRDRDFGWTVEMQLKAHVARLRIEEVAVRYRPRIGESKITGTLLGTLLAGYKILGWILAWRVRLTFSRPGSPRSR
ncbi:MAG: glycosyltransferase family 2 protein [Planctomycetes bacterium]|nr:glycosyltransferase family 2 protein [Planctomycetota bacterium]